MEGVLQALPTALQVESTLHVQVAAPAAPVQDWCVPHDMGAA
jgi:hypothetical protein